jgi:two-component system, NarL family, nitrate/nitrite response regulator NarL
MTTILIVDDHPLVRKGLISLFSFEEDLSCIGEAATNEEAFHVIIEKKPDIILVDLRLGNESGFDLVEKVASKKEAKSKFIVLTSSAHLADFQKAKDVGAHGYILKEALPEELLFAIRLVSSGRKYYDPGIMELVMGDSEEDDYISSLTPKEMEVLKELGSGLSNREIASKLFISENTVKKHVSQILDKLQLSDRTQAALFANVKGIAKFIVG